MWIGVLLVCLNPSALSCEIVAKTDAFFSEEVCIEEGKTLAANLIQKNVYAVPACFAIGTLS